MPKRTASNPGASISLFPFLAVLICTMGSLVTLLFAFAKHGQEQAVQSAAAKAAVESSSSEVAAEREGLQWRIEQLRSARDKTQEQLSEKRLELSHVEDHLRRLREQADHLRIEAEALEESGLASSGKLEDARSELDRLRRAIEERERDLQDEKPREKQSVTYSVVPYEGPNQTRRRPIYIECRSDAVVLQSEGIAFRESDFEPPLGPGNPLAAAIRAYNEHLNRIGFNGETTRPYPMLLVRPDGIVAYYAARAALESWGNEFGYELVGADWTLDFPPSDGTLAMSLERVVSEARLRQSALAAAAPRQFLKRSRGALRASPDGRGFVAESDGESGDSPYGGQGFASRYNRNATGTGTGSGSGSFEPGGSAWSSNGGRGTGFGDRPAGDDRHGSGGSAFDGESNSFGDRSSGGGSQESPGENIGSAGDRYAGSNAGRNGEAGTADGGPSLGMADGTTGGNAGARQGAFAGQPGGSNQKEFGEYGTPEQGYQSGSQGQTGSPDSSATGSQASAAGSSGGAGNGGSQESQAGSPSISAQIPHGNKSRSVASERGKDWGLPGASQNSVPISRPIVVRCETDKLTILPDDNRSLPKHIELGYRTEDSVDALVSGVWDHMKGWGLAGRGMYWRPSLVMEVEPNAVVRFGELQALLADSGLDVQMRTSNAHKPAQNSPRNRR